MTILGSIVLDTPDYVVSFQEALGVTWVHAQIRKYSPAIARRLIKEFSTIANQRTLFAVNEPHLDKKHIRFLRMHGFVFFKEIAALDGGVRHIYIRECYGT